MWQSDIISSKPFLPYNIIPNHTVDNNPSHDNEINASGKEECILQFFLPQIKNYKGCHRNDSFYKPCPSNNMNSNPRGQIGNGDNQRWSRADMHSAM